MFNSWNVMRIVAGRVNLNLSLSLNLHLHLNLKEGVGFLRHLSTSSRNAIEDEARRLLKEDWRTFPWPISAQRARTPQPWKIVKPQKELARAQSRELQPQREAIHGSPPVGGWEKFIEVGRKDKAQLLIQKISPISNVKSELYSALNEWVAFQQKFPLPAVKEALKILKNEGKWWRIIQVSKWMLSKGQGGTVATYDLMLKAYDKEGRLEEAEMLWRALTKQQESLPKAFFARIINMYYRHEMHQKALEVFEIMEESNVRPNMDQLERLMEIYEKLGMPDKRNELLERYADKLKKQKKRRKNSEKEKKEEGSFKHEAENISQTLESVPQTSESAPQTPQTSESVPQTSESIAQNSKSIPQTLESVPQTLNSVLQTSEERFEARLQQHPDKFDRLTNFILETM